MWFGKFPSNFKFSACDCQIGLFRLMLIVSIFAFVAIECPEAKPAGGAAKRTKTISKASPVLEKTPSAPWVDSVRITKMYMQGDFEEAIGILEANLKETRQYGHDDSVFIYKHLGVMYAAQYTTREKGKYYMHRLLMVEPTARIMDMYASDMIYMIFKNIQEEYEQSRMLSTLRRPIQGRATPGSGSEKDSMPGYAHAERKEPVGNTSQPSIDAEKKGTSIWPWVLGAAVVGGGIGLYVMSASEPETTTEEIVVKPNP